MALLTKGNINQFGVTEEYWKITNININLIYNYVDITVSSYTSKEARDNNYEAMNFEKIRAKWDDKEFNKYFSPMSMNMKSSKNIYDIAYEYIKHKKEIFKNAENC